MRALALALLVLTASATPVMAYSRAEGAKPGIGRSITLHSRIYGSAARITLLKAIDPAMPSYPSKLRPRLGDRWVAVRLRIRGLGGTWTDAPASDGRLLDSRGDWHKAFLSGYGTVEPRMPMGLALIPGQAMSGNLVFELPKTAKLRTFEYVVTGGDTGVWDLTG
jgi:hypothetical protein